MSVAPRHSCRSPRVLRTHLHAYACRIYVIAFRASIGLRPFLPPHPATPPLSASCSSGQRFALSFLRIRSRPRHPCLRLTLLLAECVEDFHLQVRAPCRAHKKKRGHGRAFLWLFAEFRDAPASIALDRCEPRRLWRVVAQSASSSGSRLAAATQPTSGPHTSHPRTTTAPQRARATAA